MEHRYARREAVELDVTLAGPQCVQQPAKIRNISLDGMYVETAEDVLLTGAFVCVNVPPGQADARRGCRLEALVVHKSGKGAGLMFCLSGSERLRLLGDVFADVFRLSETGGEF